jgi:nitrogen fixation protein NifU and related proteins
VNIDLYHEAIMERADRAAGDHRLTDPDASATVDNPLCGDRVTLDIRLVGERIAEIGHRVRGCALCLASTAVIVETAPGATAAEMAAAEAELRDVLAGPAEEPAVRRSPLAIFRPVRAYKSRHDCVLLPFDALSQVLRKVAAGSR